MNTSITVRTSEEIAEQVPQTTEELTALFVAEQDVKDSSRALYRRTLSQFFKWIEQENLSLNALTVADVNRYKDSLLERLNSKLSVGSYIVAVRKFYEWAEAKKFYPNIAKGVKTPPKKNAYRKEHLSKQKTAELLKYYRQDRKRVRTKRTRKPLSPETICRDYAIVNLMLHTGLRTIEVTRIDIGDITYKQDRRVLKVWGKGRSDKEEDFVVLTESAFAPIEEYISKYRKNAKRGEALFTSLSRQNKGQRLTTKTINSLCTEGLKHIGLYDVTVKNHPFTPHSFRHTTAVALLKEGGDLTEVQTVLRHSSIDTSRIYTHSIEEELRLQKPSEYKIDKYFQ